MDVTLRPATGGGAWRPAARPAKRPVRPALPDRAAGLRWAAWAQRLAGRYGSDGSAWDRLAAILRAAGIGAAPAAPATAPRRPAMRRRLPWPLHMTLHLSVPVSLPIGAAATGTWAPPVPSRAAMPPGSFSTVTRVVATAVTLPGAFAPVAPDAASPAPGTLARPAARRVTDGQHDAVATRLRWSIERVTTMGRSTVVQRLLSHQAAEDSAGRSGGDWSAVPSAPRVLSQPAAALAAMAAQRSPALAPAPAPLRYWDDPAPVPPALDVERLTDQVIRSIDQRVVAARERFGRR